MRRAGVAVLFAAVVAWTTLTAVSAGATPAAQAQPQPASDVYKAVYDGWKWWHVYCYRCHGTNAVATTMAPDLLDPNHKLTRAAFLKIVRSGVPDKGMQAWTNCSDNSRSAIRTAKSGAGPRKFCPPGVRTEADPD